MKRPKKENRDDKDPQKPATETPVDEPVKETPPDELGKIFDSEVNKLREAFHSITKQINQPPKLNNEKDLQDTPNVSTSNRFEQLSQSKKTELSD